MYKIYMWLELKSSSSQSYSPIMPSLGTEVNTNILLVTCANDKNNPSLQEPHEILRIQDWYVKYQQ